MRLKFLLRGLNEEYTYIRQVRTQAFVVYKYKKQSRFNEDEVIFSAPTTLKEDSLKAGWRYYNLIKL